MNQELTKPVDPLRLAGITIDAVDHIGSKAADEIEATAEAITKGAAEVAANLKALAEAMREHTRVASDHVSAYVKKTTEVIETVRGLQAKITKSQE